MPITCDLLETSISQEESIVPHTRKFKVGDRVLYVQPKGIDGGALPYGGSCEATVIAAFGGDGGVQPPTYRLELDQVWHDRSLCGEGKIGQKIALGMIQETNLSAIS